MKNQLSAARLAVLALSLPAPFMAVAQTTAPTLAPVSVSASRVAGTRDDQPFGVSVITAEEIGRSGALTVNDAIMKILGVAGRPDSFGGGDYALDLRGFGVTSDNNQVIVVDGIKISEADTGGTRLAGIPIASVSQIEVIRGSGAVLYGEGATGGVIIVTTHSGKGLQRRNAASLYLGAGSYGLREGRASATLVSGGLSLDVSGMNREADNHRDNFRSRTEGLSVALQWSNDWLRLGASQSEDELKTGLPGALTAVEYASNPRQTTHPDDKASVKNQRRALVAEASFGAWQVLADVGRRDKGLRSQNVAGGTSYPYDYDVAASSYGLRAVHTAVSADLSNRWVMGWDHSDWQRNLLGDSPASATQNARAVYLRDELTLKATGTTLSVGTRSEQINKDNSSSAVRVDESQRAWELGLSQVVAPTASVYGRVGQSFRLANVDEFGFTSPGVVLKAQTSRDTELGFRQTGGPLRLDARLYRSALVHEIGFDVTAPPASRFFPGANVNFEPTVRRGLEVDGAYAVTAAVKLRLNGALRQSYFSSGTHVGKEVPLTSRKTVALSADWKPMEGHTLSGGINWKSSSHPDLANQCTLPAALTSHARYARSLGKTELALGVSNLTNRKLYSASDCVSGVIGAIYPEPGRAFIASLRFAF